MHKIICIFIVASLFLLTSCQREEEQQVLSEVQIEENEVSQPEEADMYVHVCGQVKNPGVYCLKEGSRLYEAIDAAGGLTEQAAADYLNQAKTLEDGEQIVVPSNDEIAVSKEAPDGRVNLNHASKEELMMLSGIGEAKADAIIKYREEHGGFQSIEEIMDIEGIKEGVFQKIKDQIKVS